MIRHLWPLATGFALWALALVGLYALQYLGCHLRWPAEVHRTALIAGYLGSIGILAATALLQAGRARRP